MRHWGPPPERYYTLIYRYRGKGSHTWTRQFTSLDSRWSFLAWTGGGKTDLSWPPLMRMAPDAPWERCADSAKSWFGTFSFMLRWAVILDPDGRVVFDWKRKKEIVTYQLLEIPEEIL